MKSELAKCLYLIAVLACSFGLAVYFDKWWLFFVTAILFWDYT